MSITQTAPIEIGVPISIGVDIPASHRLTIDVPSEVPEGRAIITFTTAPKQGAADQKPDHSAAVHVHTHPCPICAAHMDPVTGEMRFNAETVAAIEEGRAMMRGEIPAKRFSSLKEMLEDLDREDPDDPDGLGYLGDLDDPEDN